MLSHILFTANEVITNDYSNTHKAIDVIGEGRSVSDIIAYEDGKVVLIINNVKKRNTNTTGTATYGNFIKIKHKNNIQTLYAHLKYGSIKVKVGDTVKKGQVIASMGDTGRAFGVHLHFEVMDYNNKRKNPNDYLRKASATLVSNEKNNAVNSNLNTTNVQEPDKNNEPIVNEKKEVIEDKVIEENSPEEEITEEPIFKSEELNEEFTLFENNEYKYMSLSDALDEIYVNNSYDYRILLAHKNGVNNYTGSKVQNLKLLQMLKEGKLRAVY